MHPQSSTILICSNILNASAYVCVHVYAKQGSFENTMLSLHLLQHIEYVRACIFIRIWQTWSLERCTGCRRWMDALRCRSLFAKEPLIIGPFCGKWPPKIRHPMGLVDHTRTHAHTHTLWRDVAPYACICLCYMYYTLDGVMYSERAL